MILEIGDTILVSHRRMFQHDETRFFVGNVIAREHDLLKVAGFTFVRDLSNGHILRKDEPRIKILSLASPSYIFYQLPGVADIATISIQSQLGSELLVDGDRLLMNLAERSHSGHF